MAIFTKLITTGVLGGGFALISMALLLYIFVRKMLFEARPRKRIGLVMPISFLSLTRLFVFAIITVYLVISLNIFNVEYVALSLMLTGICLLPAAVLVKIREGG